MPFVATTADPPPKSSGHAAPISITARRPARLRRFAKGLHGVPGVHVPLPCQTARVPLAAYRCHVVEERFIYRKPPIGKAKAAVVLNGGIRVEHPLLKAPVAISLENVACSVRVAEVVDEDIVLRRDATLLNLTSVLTEPNVILVFRSPVRIERFKFGAENGLPISAKERKHGIDMDALGVAVEDADGLVSALARRGTRLVATVGLALRELVGEATGVEAVGRRREVARRRIRTRVVVVASGVVWTALLAARFAFAADEDNVPAATVVGLIASSLAWAVLVALVVTSTGGVEGGRRPVRDALSGSRALGYLAGLGAMLVVPLVVAGWMASHLGTPHALAYGLVAGVPGGLMCGLGLRATRGPEINN